MQFPLALDRRIQRQRFDDKLHLAAVGKHREANRVVRAADTFIAEVDDNMCAAPPARSCMRIEPDVTSACCPDHEFTP